MNNLLINAKVYSDRESRDGEHFQLHFFPNVFYY